MTTLIERAPEILWRTLKVTAGTRMVYQSSSGQIPLWCVRHSTFLRSTDEEGLSIVSRSQDFTVRTTDLAISGTTVEPRKGDTIYTERDGEEKLFLVVSYFDEPCWTWRDPYHYLRIIRTKEVLDALKSAWIWDEQTRAIWEDGSHAVWQA